MKRQQAHRDLPLAIHPYGRPIYADNLDYSLREGARVFLAWTAAAVVCLAIVIVLSLPGN